MHNTSEISKIELVECGFGVEENTAYENVLVNIDDINGFIDDFSKVKYKRYLFPGTLLYFNYSDFGIKITYENGDYEVIHGGRTTEYRSDIDEYDICNVTGFFDDKQKDAFLRKYLSLCESPILYLMHDKSEIEKVEIVDAYAINDFPTKADEHVQEMLAEVDDIELFINQLNQLEYNYQAEVNASLGRFKETERRNAIKIYYINGDYEIFGNNWRDFYVKWIDEYVNDAYIGEFDYSEFSSFLEETISSNSIPNV